MAIKIVSMTPSSQIMRFVISVCSADNYVYTTFQEEFITLPEINYEKEKNALSKLENSVSRGDYETLLFMLQSIIKECAQLKGYEPAGNVRESYRIYLNYVEQLKKDRYAFANTSWFLEGRSFLILTAHFNLIR